MNDLRAQVHALCDEKKFEEALALLHKEMGNMAPDAALHYDRGKIYFRLQRYQEAVADLSAAIQLAPSAHFYSERALAHHLNNQHAEAMADFDYALSLEPENPFRYSSRAFIKDRMGDTKGAIADYQKAVALDPEDAVAYNNLGLLLEKQGYQKEAKESFQKADKLADGEAKVEKTTPQREIKNPASEIEIEEVGEPPKQEKMSGRHLWKTMEALFRDPEERQAFTNFLKGKKK